jgi:hypothetical protein
MKIRNGLKCWYYSWEDPQRYFPIFVEILDKFVLNLWFFRPVETKMIPSHGNEKDFFETQRGAYLSYLNRLETDLANYSVNVRNKIEIVENTLKSLDKVNSNT